MNDTIAEQPPPAAPLRSGWLAYGFAGVAVASATLLRLAFDPAFGDNYPFVTFFLAVTAVAWFGRTGPACFALGGGGLVAFYLFVPPRNSLTATEPGVVGTGLFLLVGGVVVAMSHTTRVARNRAERLLAEAGARQGEVGRALGAEAEQRERLRTTLASIGDAVISTDAVGNVTYLNAVAESLTGWTSGEASGRPLDAVFHIVNEGSRDAVENPATRALTAGVIVGLANHTVLIARDGTERPIDDSAAPIRDRGGAVVGCVLVFRDISERKRLEAAERAAQRRIVATLESITDAFSQFDRDWRITYVNAEAERLTGRPRSELLGRSHWEAFPTTVGTPLEAEYRRAVAERVTVEFEHYFGPLGRWFAVKGDPTPDGGLAVFFRDITERKEAEREIARLAAAAERQRRLYDTVLANTPDLAYVFDLNHRFTYANPALLALWGKTWDEAVGKNCLELGYEPWHAAMHDAEIERVVATRQPIRGEVAFTGTSGRRQYDYIFVPVIGADGGVEAVAGTTRDVTERKEAEERLRASEERGAFVRRSSGVGFWYCDLPFDVLQWDELVKAHFHLPPDAVVTIDTFYDRIHPDDRGPTRRAIERSIAGRAPYDVDYRTVNPDTGAVAWVRAIGRTFYAEDGTPTRFDGVTLDVTARHEAEAERARLLRSVEAERGRLAEVFRQAPAFLCVLRGPDHVFELANERYDRLVGHRDLLGKPVRAALPEVAEQGFIGLLDGVYRTGEPFVGTGVRLQFDQAGERYVDFVYQALRDPGGAVTGIVTVGVDVTARHTAEADLARLHAETERERRLFAAVLSNTPDFIYTFDLAGRFVYVNAPLLALWGKGVHEAVGRTFHDLDYPPALADRLHRQIRQVIDTRQPVRDETPYTGTVGEREYEYIFVPVLGAGGTVEAVAGSTRDITDRKRAEEELRRLAADLSDADRRKDEFLATLAHELRNPLAPIRNGLQVIKLAGANGTVEQARSMMERQLTQLVRLVDDLLDVSRITRGKLDLRKERVEVRAVIDAAVETSRPLIDQAGHALAVVVPDEPVFVDGDAARLAQVVSNLLTNSAKYTHRGGRVRLTVRREGETVAVSVADDGIGIPPDMLGRVFEMFTQVDRALEKTTGGLGIGLSLVKGLVEMHGGTIAARSDGEGKGSEFVVTLPAAVPAPGGPGATGAPAEEAAPAARRRVLVVDDNVDAADSLAQLLEMLGNEVRTANDGEAGVAAAAAFRPGVVLMDIGMPKLNGYEACRRIRGQPWGKDVVLVALTGWGQEDDRQQSSDAGFNLHLVKPVEFAALSKLLAACEASAPP